MSKRFSYLIALGAALLLMGGELLPAVDQTPEPATKLVERAVAKARAENKVVFIHTGASW